MVSMPFKSSQMLVCIGIPHTNGLIVTTRKKLVGLISTIREEIVIVDGETPHITSMPFQGSQMLVCIGIPHTNGVIKTTREELVAV